MAWEEFNEFTSTNISNLRYDKETWTMEVSFHGGGVYQYFDVPLDIWLGMKTAPSQGQYLNATVKGTYRYSKV